MTATTTTIVRQFNTTGKTFSYSDISFTGVSSFNTDPENLLIVKTSTPYVYYSNSALYLNNIEIPSKAKIDKAELVFDFFVPDSFIVSFYAKNESTPALPMSVDDWMQTWNKTPKKIVDLIPTSTISTATVDLKEIFQFIVDKDDWYGLGNILLAIDYDETTEDSTQFLVIFGYTNVNFPSISIQYTVDDSDGSGGGLDVSGSTDESGTDITLVSAQLRGVVTGSGSHPILSSSGNNPTNSCSDVLLVKNGTFSQSPDVFVNGIGVVRANDLVAQHPKIGCGIDTSTLKTFSSSVFVNGLGIGRKGDKYISDDGTETNEILGGSVNVFAS